MQKVISLACKKGCVHGWLKVINQVAIILICANLPSHACIVVHWGWPRNSSKYLRPTNENNTLFTINQNHMFSSLYVMYRCIVILHNRLKNYFHLKRLYLIIVINRPTGLLICISESSLTPPRNLDAQDRSCCAAQQNPAPSWHSIKLKK